MPWSRSTCRLSSRKENSRSRPRLAETARTCSMRAAGREPVSCSNRPTRVDLPWSTWPTTTMGSAARSAAGGGESPSFIVRAPSQVAADAQALEGVFGLVVHGAPVALGAGGAAQLGDDGGHVRRLAGDREGDADLAERAVALAALGEVQRDDRDLLPRDVAPHVQL